MSVPHNVYPPPPTETVRECPNMIWSARMLCSIQVKSKQVIPILGGSTLNQNIDHVVESALNGMVN
jgi:hypothetical protein